MITGISSWYKYIYIIMIYSEIWHFFGGYCGRGKKKLVRIQSAKIERSGTVVRQKTRTVNNKLWLVESSQIIWRKWLGDSLHLWRHPKGSTCSTYQSQAQRPYGPSISVKLEGLGKVPGAEFAGKILQMFGRQFGKFNAHFWGFEYDMMWYDMIMWYIIQDIRYKYVYIYMWYTVECDIIWIRYVSKWVPVNKSIF